MLILASKIDQKSIKNDIETKILPRMGPKLTKLAKIRGKMAKDRGKMSKNLQKIAKIRGKMAKDGGKRRPEYPQNTLGYPRIPQARRLAVVGSRTCKVLAETCKDI